ncbi:unnamed protein product [Burkholderia pseudomallei]|nr:unnamed protein product [Burkholderia pseudomallei]VUD44474.1 unnamed protein product [Burkholderia pseudomallei]
MKSGGTLARRENGEARRRSRGATLAAPGAGAASIS